ncbi:MAG TPA: aminoglycoside adenylyltransferase domain-containing protein [Pyrinomonadaceae bacterium]|nr:aminoglycoside adenylyltransferase domain-containing protein [Pyrinomonadaceae bacterium]
MARIPAQVSDLLDDLATNLPVILGRNMVGIYLYGSLTQAAFNSKRSDVDCIVVTERDMSKAQFKKLGTWLAHAAESNPWATRLQILFLIKTEVLTMNSKACLYQFGLLKRSGSDGNPIIWMNVLKSGVVLHGPSPESFVPLITPEILFQALEREVNYLREEISQKPESDWRDVPSYRAYSVLTLCRILYSFRKGAIVSKRRAATWAIKNLPKEWRELILQALETYDANHSIDISLSLIEQFIDFADAQLHAAPVKSYRQQRTGRHGGKTNGDGAK